MEEIICVNNAINEFEIDNDLELTKTESKAIKEGASCGEGFEEAAITILVETLSDSYPGLTEETQNWIEDNINEFGLIKSLLKAGDLDEEDINEIVGFIKDNPNYTFEFILNNKTELNSANTETWDSADGPFAEHPIEDFDDTQVPWPSYGPVIDKSDAVLYNIKDYDCHVFAKAQLAKVGYTISNYFLEYVDEGSPNNVIHYETIQVFKEFEDVDPTAIDNSLDYLYSALKRNIPVLVGISYKTGSSNPDTDSTTDHFVVIVGMGTDEKGNYFSFYDNGSAELEKATHSENKLYFEGDKFIGKSYADNLKMFTYRLTQIRKSKPE